MVPVEDCVVCANEKQMTSQIGTGQSLGIDVGIALVLAIGIDVRIGIGIGIGIGMSIGITITMSISTYIRHRGSQFSRPPEFCFATQQE